MGNASIWKFDVKTDFTTSLSERTRSRIFCVPSVAAIFDFDFGSRVHREVEIILKFEFNLALYRFQKSGMFASRLTQRERALKKGAV